MLSHRRPTSGRRPSNVAVYSTQPPSPLARDWSLSCIRSKEPHPTYIRSSLKDSHHNPVCKRQTGSKVDGTILYLGRFDHPDYQSHTSVPEKLELPPVTKLHAFITAPAGTQPTSTFRHNAITSFRTRPMIMMRRMRPCISRGADRTSAPTRSLADDATTSSPFAPPLHGHAGCQPCRYPDQCGRRCQPEVSRNRPAIGEPSPEHLAA